MNSRTRVLLREAPDRSGAGAAGAGFAQQRQPDRTEELRRLLQDRILVIDGAMGTMIQAYKLEEADYRGDRFVDHAFPKRQ